MSEISLTAENGGRHDGDNGRKMFKLADLGDVSIPA
jgi:hypothetical protein